MKPNYKKLSIISATVLILTSFPAVTRADLFGIGSFAAAAIGKIAFTINFIIGYIAGIAFNLGGWAINFALTLNSTILNLSMNQFLASGWQVILGFADLALILGIIVIAFATILHIENYGMKQSLWRLIVVALLVNFSLVIAGVFMDVSGIITGYFVDRATDFGAYDMATTLASAFNIQQLLDATHASPDQAALLAGSPDTLNSSVFDTFGSAVLMAISSIFFTFVFTVISAIVLFAIFVMLMIRYVYLTLLLILSPLAMVAWVFQGTRSLWQKWWSKFLNWTFFAPIVTFFLYLTIASMRRHPFDSIINANSALPVGDALQQKGIMFAVGAIGQMIATIGLLVGSLIAAQALSISGATHFIGTAGRFGKGVRSYASTRAQRLGWGATSKVTGSETVKKATTTMASSKYAPVRWASRGVGALGTKAETGVAKEAREAVKGYSNERLTNEILASRGPRRNVLLEHAAKEGKLDKKVIAELLSDSNKMEGLGKEFKSQGLDFGNVEKSVGYNSKILAEASKGPREFSEEALRNATKEFHSGLRPEDYEKWKGQFLYKAEATGKDYNLNPALVGNLRDSYAYGIAATGPGKTGKIYPKMKSEEIKNFSEIYDKNVEKLPNEQDKIKARRAQEKAKSKRLFFMGDEKEEKKEEAPKPIS